ncbi:hypothetical protein SLS64_008049 [Diaporthe eres]
MATDNVNSARGDFHLYLPTPGSIPLPHLDRTNVYEFSKACLADPWMKDLVGQWTDGLKGQFYGITTDGTRVEDLYELQDEGAPTEAATIAANRLVDALTPDEKLRVIRELDSEDCFMLYGRPSLSQPWGFSLSGHHLILSIFFIENQMVIGPAFLGGEPNVIVEGANKGEELFHRETVLALKLMQNLTPEQQRQAQKTDVIHEPEEPGWNAVDQRHLTGTSQDNRIIAYEGVPVSALTPESQDLVVSVIEVLQELLPPKPLAHRLRLVRQHLSETYFTWTGKFGDDDPFYFRIQSPVVLIEMDHHTGIYLTNKEPGKFHIHTIHRLPNGGDYGRELIQKWRQKHPVKPPMQRMDDQAYYLVKGSIKVRLGDVVHDVSPGSLVFIPAGLPHCNWNPGPGSETHLEMIIPATDRLKQIAYMVDKPEDVPPEWQTSRKGYTMSLADPSSGCDTAVILYAEVGPQNGGPGTHVHEFDQYYFVLEGELTIEVALQKYVVTRNKLVVLPAGVPHRQYNEGDVAEKHLTINTPAPEPGRLWDFGVTLAPDGVGHYGSLTAAREIHDGALSAV